MSKEKRILLLLKIGSLVSCFLVFVLAWAAINSTTRYWLSDIGRAFMSYECTGERCAHAFQDLHDQTEAASRDKDALRSSVILAWISLFTAIFVAIAAVPTLRRKQKSIVISPSKEMPIEG